MKYADATFFSDLIWRAVLPWSVSQVPGHKACNWMNLELDWLSASLLSELAISPELLCYTVLPLSYPCVTLCYLSVTFVLPLFYPCPGSFSQVAGHKACCVGHAGHIIDTFAAIERILKTWTDNAQALLPNFDCNYFIIMILRSTMMMRRAARCRRFLLPADACIPAYPASENISR